VTVDPFWVAVPRDVVRVVGPDAVSFLQGQLSQDVAQLDVGASAWSFLLQPQGKVEAWLRVARVADDELLLDVDGGFGEAVIARLDRFKLRTKADLVPLPWRCVSVRGTTAGPSAGLALDAAWPEVVGVDVLGEDPAPPEGVREGTADELEELRIRCGVPAMGRELTDRTIPAESGVVERSVSFTKGCYTGQELVARIDSRGGNVPRHLRGLVVEDGAAAGPVLVPGAPVVVGGAEVGVVTSAVDGVALAYVKRDVQPPVEAEVAGRVARIGVLPLLRSRP
jgi:folate-binding protein YgfZ